MKLGAADLDYPSSLTRRGRVIENGKICPTLTTETIPNVIELGNPDFYNFLYEIDGEIYLIRIRKLIPRECWRLMDFTDEDFEKAKWKRETLYLKGSESKQCNAKLTVVTEKPKQGDTETYVSCTIKDFPDMETTLTEWMKPTKDEPQEKETSVNFVIERLEERGHLGCATNITKCIEIMGTRFFMTENPGQKATDIIASVRTGNTNTEKYMRIITESNLSPRKLSTILTLTALIIASKIFGATTQQVSIKGFMPSIDVCGNNILMKISSLEMGRTTENMSNSMLYKQAGNSIVKAVLMAIFKQMM